MNLEYFIAKRLVTGKESKGYVSRSIVSITTFGISLSLAVMIISVSVVTGFKESISNKVIGFNGDIQIENFDSNTSFETNPISVNQSFLPELGKLPGIKHIQRYAITAGMMKKNEENQGVVLKGIGKDYDWTFFKKNLIAGNIFPITDSAISNNILVSKTIANLLKLKIDDEVAVYFVKDPPRARRFKISGIYETGMDELDKVYIVGDIRHVQSLNEWDSTLISGFEINIVDFHKLADSKNSIQEMAGLNLQSDGSALKIQSIREKYPQLFDWLELVNMNVWIIIGLMLLVAGFNMISGLMILILERTRMIGLLTALGARSVSIRKIFIYQSGFLVLKGLLWGNIVGILICFLQFQFHIVKLDQSSYFITSVPINMNLINYLLLNLGTLFAIILMLVFPSLVISRISPDITLRYQ